MCYLHLYVMLCYLAICIAPLAEGYSEVLSALQAGEKKSEKHNSDHLAHGREIGMQVVQT